jgi:hypothetical protein
MREAFAIIRPYGIDSAFIGLFIEELAGQMFIHPVAFFIFLKPFFAECSGCHAEMPGNSLYIFNRVCRRHGFAAVGAGQTISFFPDFIFNLYQGAEQLMWLFFLQL